MEKLDIAVDEIASLPLEPVKDNVRNIAQSIGEILQVRRAIYDLKPELETVDSKERIPDPPLTEEQKIITSALTKSEVENIDSLLLSNADQRFRKVARVISQTMYSDSNKHRGLPDIFYSQQIKNLVATGKLVAQGNLDFMRFSEIRLPEKSET